MEYEIENTIFWGDTLPGPVLCGLLLSCMILYILCSCQTSNLTSTQRSGLAWKWLSIPPYPKQTQCQQYLSCYWPNFDETLTVGSLELLEQIPTVTVTFVQAIFVQATFVLVTFIHIRNISAVKGKSKVKGRLRGMFNNSNSFNEYQINFYRPQLTPYEQLQQ